MSPETQHVFVIRRTATPPSLDGAWESPVWAQAETLDVGNFYGPGRHRPETQVRTLYDEDALYVLFRVTDRFVRCTRTRYQEAVHKDACVEFFVKPRPDKGYLNFEVNCGGALVLKYIVDPERTADGFAAYEDVPWEQASQLRIYHSLPVVVEPEIAGPIDWTVEYAIPRALLETYAGPLGLFGGSEWRGNFYKCAEDNSHPHWASWAPIGEILNFHQPDRFGLLRFAR